MYFPFLRGKLYELALLKELKVYLAESGKIIPIVEPVNDNLASIRTLVRTLNKASAPFALVTNPSVGAIKGTTIAIADDEELHPHPNAYLAQIINRNTEIHSIVSFLNGDVSCKRLLIHDAEIDDARTLHNEAKRSRYAVTHAFIDGGITSQYMASFRDQDRVLIRDGFRKAERNEDYRGRDGEFFSDLHLTYKDSGFVGMGDYAMIGKPFAKGGFKPYTVAIHSTFADAGNNSLRIRHFLSDKLPNSDADVEGKIDEALTKMRDYLDLNPCDCEGCAGMMEIQEQGAAQVLGLIKKLSLHHHIKLMEAQV